MRHRQDKIMTSNKSLRIIGKFAYVSPKKETFSSNVNGIIHIHHLCLNTNNNR